MSVMPDELSESHTGEIVGEIEAEGFLYFRCGSAGLVPAAKLGLVIEPCPWS